MKFKCMYLYKLLQNSVCEVLDVAETYWCQTSRKLQL